MRWVLDDGTNQFSFGDEAGVDATLLRGVGGVDMPEVRLGLLEAGATPGSVVTGVRVQHRVLSFPLWVPEAKMSALRAVLKSAVEGPVTLYFYGAQNLQTAVRYQSGMGARRRVGDGYNIPLMLVAPWPYFEDQTEVVSTYSGGDLPLVYPIGYPFRVLDAAVFAADVVSIAGDARVWPTWEIRGPFSRVELTRNAPGGKVQTIVRVSASEYQTLRIVTKPLEREVTLSGESVFSTVEGEFWGFEPGVNEFSVAAVDPTTGTSVTLRYRVAYQEAY